ncbi:MAG: gamma-glutamyltransferase, partial [Pseudomonadota bacterium]
MIVLAGCRHVADEARAAAVAMPDEFSRDTALAVLESGGNAVDAAIAAAFVLAVTYPEAGNLGGGGFMLVYVDGDARFLDYREVAPAAATADMYLDEAGDVVDNLSLIGPLAAGVPGTVAGLREAHRRYGTLPWTALLEDAVQLADAGFIVPPLLAQRIAAEAARFDGRTNFHEFFGRIRAGRRFRQPALAATLRRIAAAGAAGFYAGETAAHIQATMTGSGGLITAGDLDAYRPVWREPLLAPWRQYTVVTAPPPSSGGFAVLQLLGMKDALADEFRGHAHNSARYVHLIAEMAKRVFADRAEYFGDPDFVDVPIARLIDPGYIARRAGDVDPGAISALEAAAPGLEPPQTTHFSIVDFDGNAVANTYTLNTSFGSGVVVAGAGFLLNNEMDDFSAKPDVPNFYGVVGGSANAIAPGKRMLSSMSPTIVLDGGRVDAVLGTPGGST